MLTSAQTGPDAPQNATVAVTDPNAAMTLGERVIVISVVAAIVLVAAFAVVALAFPEKLPWRSDPETRTPPPRSGLWEDWVT